MGYSEICEICVRTFTRFAVPLNNVRGTSTKKMNEFILFCLRFAVPLQKIGKIEVNYVTRKDKCTP